MAMAMIEMHPQMQVGCDILSHKCISAIGGAVNPNGTNFRHRKSPRRGAARASSKRLAT
jgi:hypothetical protein